MDNFKLSIVKTEDRTEDGNLRPEARERAVNVIRQYLRQTGYLNITEMSSMLGLSRQTTKKLVNEIIDAWREKTKNHVAVQIKWYQSIAKKIDENPETIGKKEMGLIKLKSNMLGRINTLMKLMIVK